MKPNLRIKLEVHLRLSIEDESSTGLVLGVGGLRSVMERILQSWYRRERRRVGQRRESHLSEFWKDRGVWIFTNKGWSQIVGTLEFKIGKSVGNRDALKVLREGRRKVSHSEALIRKNTLVSEYRLEWERPESRPSQWCRRDDSVLKQGCSRVALGRTGPTE